MKMKGIPPCLRSSFLTASTPPVFSMKSYMTFEVSLSFSWASEIPQRSKRFFSSGSKLFTCKWDTLVLSSLECGDILKLSFILGEKIPTNHIVKRNSKVMYLSLSWLFKSESTIGEVSTLHEKLKVLNLFPPQSPLPIPFYNITS